MFERIALRRIEIAEKSGNTFLDLNSLKLINLPMELWRLRKLRNLKLKDNNLSEFPQELVQLTNLKYLTLHGNRLKELPPELGKLTNLKELYLGGNQLTELPPELVQLINLSVLALQENQFTEFPPGLVQLTNLKELYLSENQLTELPPELGQLTNLEKLDLSENQLTELPPELGQLTNLEKFYFKYNQFTEFPQELVQLTNLKYLTLHGNRLKELPPELGKLTNLEKLYIGENQLTELPPELGKLINLNTLALYANEFTELPPELGQLTNLEKLYLSENQLTELPPELGKLINLNLLTLGGNQFTEFPPELVQLTNLKELTLPGNRLTKVPPQLGQLAKLKELNLSENQLKELPPELGQLTNLEKLYLSENQLTELPPELGNLTKLQILEHEGNELEFPPPEIVKQGTQAVLAYLCNLLEKGKTERYYAKLLILGDGAVGKTCISRALRRLTFKEQIATHGVDIDPWTFDHPGYQDDESKKITLNIWDFEGQEINHQAHQFFLTERSLYIVAFKGREQFRMDRVEYWLDTIRARAPDVEVVLVATECEEKAPHVPLDKLKARYPDLLKAEPFFFAIGCANGRNIGDLQEHLKRQATCLELVGEPWPKNYANAEAMVRESSKDKSHITRNELYEIFQESEVEEDDYDRLAAFLGDTGIITHFPDCSELRDFIVLKPQWLTKAISYVLEHEDLVKNQGECMREWLRQEWEPKYTGLSQELYNCMKEFELLYQLEDDPNINLIPLRFSYTKPEIPWSHILGAKERRIQYRFNINPPAGIMSRFIVKTHHMIATTNEMPKGVYWYNGVFLRIGGGATRSEALCEFNRYDKTLSITVKAAYPQNMVEQLHGFAEAVFAFFKGLRPERYYGCVKEDESQCEGVHSERRIKYALTRKKIIDCEYGYHDVNPLLLVTGLSSFAQSVSLDEKLVRMFREELERQPKWAESFGDNINSLVLRSNKHDQNLEKLLEANEQLTAEVYQMGQQLLRELLRGIDQLLDERHFHPIPSIFTIFPVDQRRWDLRTFFNYRYRLTPLCEHEEGMHRVDFYVEFQCPQEWWQKTAPVLSVVVKVLKLCTSISLTAVPLSIDASQIKDEIDFMKELVNAIPKLEGGADSDISYNSLEGLMELKASTNLRRGKGRLSLLDLMEDENRLARMELARLLEELAPKNYKMLKWGELERMRYPDNTYRWLCKKHRK